LRPPEPASAPFGSGPVQSPEPSGRVVVFWLFIGLALATAGVLVYFASIAPVEARPRIYASLVGNLMIPVIAWYVFKHMPRNRRV
jgi:hypothetical protein